MSIVQSTYMECKTGSSNKWYEVRIEDASGDYMVAFNHGPIGGWTQGGIKTQKPVNMATAQKIYDKLVKSKMVKQYVEVNKGGGAVATTVQQTAIKKKSRLSPQLLNEIPEKDVEQYIKDPNWGGQEKFDGKRMMLDFFLGPTTKFQAINRKSLECPCDPSYEPEVRVLADLNGFSQLVLDGESVGPTYYTFDLMVKNMACGDRHDALKEIMSKYKNKTIRFVKMARTEQEKRELYERLQKQGREGIVFKRLDSPYKPGRPNTGGDHLKFKFYATASCIVAKINKKRSIGLELVDGNNGAIIDVGNCTIGGNKPIPKVGEIVEIKYLYYFKGGSLYQPSYLGVRDDIDASDCLLSQLKYKSEYGDEIPAEAGTKAVVRRILWKE